MILVTGGLGFIGTHTTNALLELGESCVVTRWPNDAGPDFSPFIAAPIGAKVAVEEVDTSDRSALLEIGERYEITGIVHLALPPIGALGLFEDFHTTLVSLVNVLEAAHEWRAPRVVVASSIAVYPADAQLPLRENERLEADSDSSYSAFKKVTELATAGIAMDAGLEAISVRISPTWGPLYHSMEQLVARLVHAAVAGSADYFTPPRRAAYAEDSLDMTYVKDTARGLALLQTAPVLNHRTYNLGSGRATKKRDVVAAIRVSIPHLEFELEPGRDPKGNPLTDSYYGDLSRITADTGYVPAYDLERAMAEYIGWLRAGHAF